ncbi:MAG: hypothetical protein AABY32_01695 [Nanoarchaeota archaeon]
MLDTIKGYIDCPICGAELEYTDYYGRLFGHQDGKKLGEIYKCPNGVEQNGSCDSELFSVAGSFYTDRQGNLHEGYPC